MGYGHLALAELQTRDLETPAPTFQEVAQVDSQNALAVLRLPETLGAYDIAELVLLSAFTTATPNPFSNKTAEEALAVLAGLGRTPMVQAVANADIGKTFSFQIPITKENLGKTLFLAATIRDSSTS